MNSALLHQFIQFGYGPSFHTIDLHAFESANITF